MGLQLLCCCWFYRLIFNNVLYSWTETRGVRRTIGISSIYLAIQQKKLLWLKKKIIKIFTNNVNEFTRSNVESKNKVFVKKKKKLCHSVKTKLVNNIKNLFFYSFKVFIRNLLKFSHIFFSLKCWISQNETKGKIKLCRVTNDKYNNWLSNRIAF